MRVYGGRIFRLREHLHRLDAGVGILGLEPQLGSDEIHALFDSLIERNGVNDGLARIYVTSGLSEYERSVQGAGGTTVVAIAQPLRVDELPSAVRAITSQIRLPVDSQLSNFKTANRLPYILAKSEAVR